MNINKIIKNSKINRIISVLAILAILISITNVIAQTNPNPNPYDPSIWDSGESRAKITQLINANDQNDIESFNDGWKKSTAKVRQSIWKEQTNDLNIRNLWKILGEGNQVEGRKSLLDSFDQGNQVKDDYLKLWENTEDKQSITTILDNKQKQVNSLTGAVTKVEISVLETITGKDIKFNEELERFEITGPNKVKHKIPVKNHPQTSKISLSKIKNYGEYAVFHYLKKGDNDKAFRNLFTDGTSPKYLEGEHLHIEGFNGPEGLTPVIRAGSSDHAVTWISKDKLQVWDEKGSLTSDRALVALVDENGKTQLRVLPHKDGDRTTDGKYVYASYEQHSDNNGNIAHKIRGGIQTDEHGVYFPDTQILDLTGEYRRQESDKDFAILRLYEDENENTIVSGENPDNKEVYFALGENANAYGIDVNNKKFALTSKNGDKYFEYKLADKDIYKRTSGEPRYEQFVGRLGEHSFSVAEFEEFTDPNTETQTEQITQEQRVSGGDDPDERINDEIIDKVLEPNKDTANSQDEEQNPEPFEAIDSGIPAEREGGNQGIELPDETETKKTKTTKTPPRKIHRKTTPTIKPLYQSALLKGIQKFTDNSHSLYYTNDRGKQVPSVQIFNREKLGQKDVEVHVAISTSWCGPCQRLKTSISREFSNPNTIKPDFKDKVFIYIDAENQPQLAQKFGGVGAGYPTTRTFRNGELVKEGWGILGR